MCVTNRSAGQLANRAWPQQIQNLTKATSTKKDRSSGRRKSTVNHLVPSPIVYRSLSIICRRRIIWIIVVIVFPSEKVERRAALILDQTKSGKSFAVFYLFSVLSTFSYGNSEIRKELIGAPAGNVPADR